MAKRSSDRQERAGAEPRPGPMMTRAPASSGGPAPIGARSPRAASRAVTQAATGG